MRQLSQWLSCGIMMTLCLLAGTTNAAFAADPGPSPPAPVVEAPVLPSGWSFRFVPYGWLTGLNGSQTVRGRTTKVNASFIDIIDDTLGRGSTLIGLMGDFEARNGPFTIFGDLVWTKLGVEGSNVRTRSVAPGIIGTVGRSLSLDIEMAILEVGAAYEVARSGPLALDVLGGARYWYQEAGLSFERTRTFDIGDLEVAGSRAFARSARSTGSIPSWEHACATLWRLGTNFSCVATSAGSG